MTRNRLLAVCCLSCLSLALAGCGGDDTEAGADASTPACTNTKCGSTCCTTGQVCNATSNACCSPTLTCTAEMECGDDGCGHSCGTCGSGSACNDATHKCETCTAETKTEFCDRMAAAGKVCGSITGVDSCTQAAKTEDCGTCSGGKTCLADNTCGDCTPATVADFCAANGKNCGSYTGTDCGAARTENCGTCSGGATCGADNVCPGTCVSETKAQFCARMATAGKVCGAITGNDNCDVSRTEDCGLCTASGQACNASNVCEACTAETDTAFCARMLLAGKECGSITATDACTKLSKTVDCGTTECTGDETCQANVCTTSGTAPANDTCANAIDITTASMPVSGYTTNGTDDSQGSCEGYYSGLHDGADVVYKFTTTAVKNVAIAVTASGTLSPAVYLRSDCAGTTDLGCETSDGASDVSLSMKRLAAGTYYVIVDGEDLSEGDFELTLTLTDPPPAPTNDTCDSSGVGAEEITLDNAGHGEKTGDTSSAAADTLGTCEYTSGGDVVYKITTTAERNITATVTFADSGASASVYMRAVCNSELETDELACDHPYDPAASFTYKHAPAGTYYIWVDSYDGDEGAYTLTVDAVEPPPVPGNDTCGTTGSTAAELTFTGDVAATTGATTAGGIDDYQGGCESYSNAHDGADVVYKFTVPAGANRSLTAVVTPDATATSFQPAVYLWAACDATTPGEMRCANADDAGTAATVNVNSVTAGTTYYVVVDGINGSEGKFDLTLTLGTEIIVNDTCATAQAVDVSSGSATVQGTNADGYNYTKGTCMSSTGAGEAIFVVDTTGMGVKNLTASVTFDDTNAWARLFVRSACDSTAAIDEVGCQSSSGETATVTGKRLAAGKYYIYVDSYSSDAGPFTLTVTLADPPASKCPSAVAIDLSSGTGGTATGTTVGGTNYTTGTCGGSEGNDAAFSFTLAADKKVTITVTPDAASTTFVPVVYLRSDCESEAAAAQSACDAASAAAGEASVVVKDLKAGTYYVWVDGDTDSGTATEGAFTVTVALDTAIPPPSNDVCGVDGVNAIPLTFGVAVNGDTTDASPDYGEALSDACYNAMGYDAAGRDLVYVYTATQADFSIEVVPTGWDASVWYTTGTCGDQAACVDGSDSGSSGVTETVAVTGATVGTKYYIYVDYFYAGSSTGCGPFTLTVK